MKRLLQQQREQDITALSLMCEREAGGEGSDSRKRRREEPASEGRQGDAKPQGGRLPGRGNSGAPTLRGNKIIARTCTQTA